MVLFQQEPTILGFLGKSVVLSSLTISLHPLNYAVLFSRQLLSFLANDIYVR